MKGAIEIIRNNLHEKINAHVVDTKRDTESIFLEVNSKSKSPVVEMQKCEANIENDLKGARHYGSKFKQEVSTDRVSLQLKA